MKDDTRDKAISECPFLILAGSTEMRRFQRASVVAKNIRILLKRRFPGVKFKITSKTHSGGDSVDIRWSDLPASPAENVVNQVVGQFEEGRWDGQEDRYVHHCNGQGFRDAFGGVSLISTRPGLPTVDELKKCGDVDARFDDGATLLHRAARAVSLELVEYLLHAGADVNARNDRQYSALMFAAKMGHTKIVCLLLDHGADIAAKNLNGETALSIAIENGKSESAALLRAHTNARDLDEAMRAAPSNQAHGPRRRL